MSVRHAFCVLLAGGISWTLQNVTFVLNDFLVFQSGMFFSLSPSGQPSQPSGYSFRMAKESQDFFK